MVERLILNAISDRVEYSLRQIFVAVSDVP